MEQILHFCRSSDGTRIAYATYNDLPNTPLVVVNPWFHPEESWRLADLHGWYVTMAGKWRLVGFDRRGIGSSQRDVTDVSIAAQVSDLAAVVDHLGLDKFHLAGFIDGAPVAAAFAAEHPSRIDRLAFTGLCGRGADAWDPGVAETLLRTIASSWPMARLALSEMVWGGLPAQLRRSRSRALAKAMSPEVAMKYVELWTGYDVRELLPRIQAPTLVMQYPAGSGALAASPSEP